jgi:hypothetical protein
MIVDTDIWRAANLLIRQHGQEAEIEAARKGGPIGAERTASHANS